MTPSYEVRAVAARTARGVDRLSGRQRLKDLVHDRLVDVEQAVTWVVVGAGPLPVAGPHVSGPDMNTWVRGEPLVPQKGAYLCEPLLDKALVEVAGPRSQKRDP